MSTQKRKLLHLYNRAAFGVSPSAYTSLEAKPAKEAAVLLRNSCESKPIKVLTESPFAKYRDQMNMRRERGAIRQMVQKEVRESRGKIRDMNLAWMNQMTDPDTMVREKLTLFWHDHFGVRNLVGYYAQEHNNTLRKHALGKYGDLLMAVTKDPAMLQFLNNQQNVKRNPNENYARELLELFTLGRGHYTEADIKNAARAFTGWGHDRFNGAFRFRRFQHDEGQKQFMGKTGNLNGDDIINIVLENPQTAQFLSAKLFQYYVSDSPDPEVIDIMAKRLYKTDYDIADLLKFTFQSDWFYEDRFINQKIKSPIELINGFRTQLGLSFGQPLAMLYMQRVMGQILFLPPSVNGWPVGAEWIDHSSLVNRMRMPGALSAGNELNIRPKDDGDDNNPLKRNGSRLVRTARMNFEAFMTLPGIRGSHREMIDSRSHLLINEDLPEKTKLSMLAEVSHGKVKESPVQWAAVTIAGLPEYQLN